MGLNWKQITKMKKLVWRLNRLPEPLELAELVRDKLLTKEEVREILFSSETEQDRDKKSLESEIKFLRELVEKISDQKKLVETIRYIEKPYIHWSWYTPYQTWCSAIGTAQPIAISSSTLTSNGSLTTLNTVGGSTTAYMPTPGNIIKFSSIKTF